MILPNLLVLHYKGDNRIFNVAQKFISIQDLGLQNVVHAVPRFSLSTIKKLTDIMYKMFKAYEENAIHQEQYLQSIKQNLKNINFRFIEIEYENEQYFKYENLILDGIQSSEEYNKNLTFQQVLKLIYSYNIYGSALRRYFLRLRI